MPVTDHRAQSEKADARRNRVVAMTEEAATRKTYRYVRIGMIGAVVLLAASVWLEHRKAPGCWQTSISAYYYTPVRAVFVGALIAIGLSLIVIKGNTSGEDVCLNLAGSLAPIVALAPTSDYGTCWSVPPNPLPTIPNSTGGHRLAGWVGDNIHNNVQALLIAAVFGLVTAAALALIAVAIGKRRGESRAVSDAWNDENRGTFLSLFLGSVLVGLGALAFYHWHDFDTRAHGYAAMTMFAILAVAAELNARACRQAGRRRYSSLYQTVATLMFTGASLLVIKSWRHRVLWVEAIEITLFATFWIVQTRELWHDTIRSAVPGSRVPSDGPTSASSGGATATHDASIDTYERTDRPS